MLIRPHDAPIDAEREWGDLVSAHPFGHLIASGTDRELPEPLSRRYPRRVPKVSSRNRSHGVKHEPRSDIPFNRRQTRSCPSSCPSKRTDSVLLNVSQRGKDWS